MAKKNVVGLTQEDQDVLARAGRREQQPAMGVYFTRGAPAQSLTILTAMRRAERSDIEMLSWEEGRDLGYKPVCKVWEA